MKIQSALWGITAGIALAFASTGAVAWNPSRVVNVQVSSTDAATAQIEAISKGEQEAFNQILEEAGRPELIGKIPANRISHMVQSMQVGQESITPRGYKASIQYTFNPSKVEQALRSAGNTASPVGAVMAGQGAQPQQPQQPQQQKQVQILSPVRDLTDWLEIKQMFEQAPGVKLVRLSAFSMNQADFTVVYEGEMTSLLTQLASRGYSLQSERGYMVLKAGR